MARSAPVAATRRFTGDDHGLHASTRGIRRSAPRRGGSVRMPGSGAVNQSILPWRWAFDFIGNQFSLSTVNLGRSSAPEVETEILDNVGSYGRQLGRIGEALEVLVRRLPRSELTESELAAIEAV